MALNVGWLHAAVSLLPPLVFLAALLVLDSYKLVRLRSVLLMMLMGGIVAGTCYVLSLFIMPMSGLGFQDYSRYVAPFLEETFKAIVIMVLISSRRIGFLVDATVLGFAVGAGFATVENLYYLGQVSHSQIGLWIVRGFGTAILHGGLQAIFAALVLSGADRRGGLSLRVVLLPLALVIALHAAFNQFAVSPIYEALLVLIVIPLLLALAFMHSERALRTWLGQGFDADQELLGLLHSEDFSESHAGRYLYRLRKRFPGAVIADLVCYLRLYVELAMYAKGLLMMRENGIEATIDAETRAKLEEMEYLEQSVGRAGLSTLKPLMQTSRRDLWQLYMLGK